MHLSETSLPTSLPLATIEIPSRDIAPAPKAENRSSLGASETFGDLSALDSTEQIQKLRVKKQNYEHIRDHIRRSLCSLDIAPSLLSSSGLQKKMPARSKSESANGPTRRHPSLSTSSRSAMRRSKTDATKVPPEEPSTGRLRVRRQNSRTSRADSSNGNLGSSSQRPGRVRRQSSRSSMRRQSSRSARSFSPAHFRKSSNSGERRRRNKSTRQHEKLNKSLSSLLDRSQDAFNESFRSLDLTSKGEKSKISNTSSFICQDSKHSGKPANGLEQAFDPERSDSFLSQDSHPSLTGAPSNGTWACACGTVMKEKLNFCGMCGKGKHWTCSGCDFDENLRLYVYCGMCGADKKQCTK